MLIEDKFFFISLPRSASTSFMASCIKQNLKIRHARQAVDIENQLKIRKKKIEDISYENFASEFNHAHEPLNVLIERFGDKYDIISVRRNKYERFISLWKHILHEMDLKESRKVFNICAKLSLDEILFYDSTDLIDGDSVANTIDTFIKKYNLHGISEYGKNMISILIKPYSDYHHHNKNIIWFEFNELYKLEEWVSNKLNIDFKLLKINSSKHYDSKLVLNDKFKEKYDSIYEIFDEIKIKKTII